MCVLPRRSGDWVSPASGICRGQAKGLAGSGSPIRQGRSVFLLGYSDTVEHGLGAGTMVVASGALTICGFFNSRLPRICPLAMTFPRPGYGRAAHPGDPGNVLQLLHQSWWQSAQVQRHARLVVGFGFDVDLLGNGDGTGVHQRSTWPRPFRRLECKPDRPPDCGQSASKPESDKLSRRTVWRAQQLSGQSRPVPRGAAHMWATPTETPGRWRRDHDAMTLYIDLARHRHQVHGGQCIAHDHASAANVRRTRVFPVGDGGSGWCRSCAAQPRQRGGIVELGHIHSF